LAYSAGYTYTTPITTNTTNPFALNAQTGNITFTAIQAETSVIAVRVNEYRYDTLYGFWEKVGSSNREIQVTVASNCLPIVNAGVKLKFPSPGVSLDSRGRQVRQYDCLDSSVMLRFTLPVEMASVSPDGSDFRLTSPNGQPIPILNLVGFPDYNGETDSLLVKLSKPLSLNGDYYLYSKVGNDGNTLLNKCGKDMNEFDTIILKVNNCINLDMRLRNVSIDEDKHPHLYWRIDPATFPQYLFNLYRVYRSADGGASYQAIASINDSAAREYVDLGVDAAKVDARSYRYYVQMILNQQAMPPTNVVHSMWLRGDLTTASSVPVVWNDYNGWNNPQYQIQWGTSIGPNLWLWENYGTPNGDTTATVLHPNLGPGLYAVRIRSVRNMSQVSAEDTAWSNWIQVGEPVPPIPPIDSVTVPNVFTPNGDGRNDGFVIRGLMSYQTERIVKIYDRWGTLVYENTNYDNSSPWEGEDRQGQQVPSGVYFYIVEAFDAPNNIPPAYPGRRRQWKGNVTVLQKP
jgi:gliding motility-associated-like protein